MLARVAFSGKFAEPMVMVPPAAADPLPAEPDAPDAALVAAAALDVEEPASGSDELPQADRASAAAMAPAMSIAGRMVRWRWCTVTPGCAGEWCVGRARGSG